MSRPLINIDNLSKSYGLQHVFSDLSIQINEGEKIALIGRNGAGKSTLLRIITGDEESDSGSVIIHGLARIGVVKQHEQLPSNKTVLQHLMDSSEKPEWDAKKMAAQFQLKGDFLEKAPTELSGGYQMRVKLVAMLLAEPNFLILDEPVNYLDLQTLILLEQFLQSYKGGFIIAAHDRTFLEHTCTLTYEVEHSTLTQFKGTVSNYLDYKAEQVQFAKRTNKKLKRQIAEQQSFVDRFRYKASLASRAQSKLKHIEKLKREIAHINPELATARISIPCSPFTKGIGVEMTDLSIGYPSHNVASGIDLEITRGEKVVIAGENGQGKSTLLKTAAGLLEPLGGTLKWWHKAQFGYYAQHTSDGLPMQSTVQEHLLACAGPTTANERILMMAGNFLFKGDDLDKPISVLSGGERARLALAGILLQPHNVLLLDEPTNHLDVETVESLAIALKQYAGTILMISHSRTFVSEIADRVVEVRGGSVRRVMGSYADYVDDLEQMAEESLKEEELPQQDSDSGVDRAEIHRQIREHKRTKEKLETEMEALEKERGKILMYFYEHPTEYDRERQERLERIGEDLERAESNWLFHESGIEGLRDLL